MEDLAVQLFFWGFISLKYGIEGEFLIIFWWITVEMSRIFKLICRFSNPIGPIPLNEKFDIFFFNLFQFLMAFSLISDEIYSVLLMNILLFISLESDKLIFVEALVILFVTNIFYEFINEFLRFCSVILWLRDFRA